MLDHVNDLRDHDYDFWTSEDKEKGTITVEAGDGSELDLDEDGNTIDPDDPLNN